MAISNTMGAVTASQKILERSLYTYLNLHIITFYTVICYNLEAANGPMKVITKYSIRYATYV